MRDPPFGGGGPRVQRRQVVHQVTTHGQGRLTSGRQRAASAAEPYDAEQQVRLPLGWREQARMIASPCHSAITGRDG